MRHGLERSSKQQHNNKYKQLAPCMATQGGPRSPYRQAGAAAAYAGASEDDEDYNSHSYESSAGDFADPRARERAEAVDEEALPVVEAVNK